MGQFGKGPQADNILCNFLNNKSWSSVLLVPLQQPCKFNPQRKQNLSEDCMQVSYKFTIRLISKYHSSSCVKSLQWSSNAFGQLTWQKIYLGRICEHCCDCLSMAGHLVLASSGIFYLVLVPEAIQQLSDKYQDPLRGSGYILQLSFLLLKTSSFI